MLLTVATLDSMLPRADNDLNISCSRFKKKDVIFPDLKTLNNIRK